MKTLILMRHAKSDWSGGEDDFERPLNRRGRGDLPRLARLLKAAAPSPLFVLSSPALRARQTAEGVIADASRLHFDEGLYLASWSRLVKALAAAGDAPNVLLVAHNPGISELAGRLGGGQFDMPTGGTALFDMHAEGWDQVEEGSGRLRWFAVPRLLKALAAEA